MPANSADSMTALWAISTGQVVLNSGKPLMLSDIYILVLILRKMNVLCDETVFPEKGWAWGWGGPYPHPPFGKKRKTLVNLGLGHKSQLTSIDLCPP